jgi:hypothetical protein
MKQQKTVRKFVICIRNEDSEDLVRGKVYLVPPDVSAFFVPISLPIAAKRALVATAHPATA